MICFLQVIGEISTTKGHPANLGPLILILTISATKDLLEDLQRHRGDEKENFQEISVGLLHTHGKDGNDEGEGRFC